MAIEITEEMKSLVDQALTDKYPCILGTASLNGHPSLSYKGSLMVFSTDKLAFWERARKGGFAQLTVNPNVVVMYRNASLRKAWRFYGQASVHESGEIQAYQNKLWDNVAYFDSIFNTSFINICN